MVISDKQRFLPKYLYSSREAVAALAVVSTKCTQSICGSKSHSSLGLGQIHDDVLKQFRKGTCFDKRECRQDRGIVQDGGQDKFMIPGASETRKIPLYTGEFYAYCAAGGILSCGITHTGVTPLDIVKCNMQVHLFHFVFTSLLYIILF
jgi:hypothetical protein